VSHSLQDGSVGKSTDRPLLLIHDDRFAAEAGQLARLFLLERAHIHSIGPNGLGAIDNPVFYIDLSRVETVLSVRAKVGARPPSDRAWAFIIAAGADRAKHHRWQVQADALGATHHINRLNAPRELKEFLSIGRVMAMPEAKVAALRKSAGGEAIHNAGAELGRLFAGLSRDSAPAIAEVAAVGREINHSVASVGADAWLSTVRTHHEGTFQHCLLVAGVVASFADRHISTAAAATRLTTAAILHDVGKAAVPLHILDKPGKLSPEEMAAVRRHPVAGYDHLRKQGNVDAQVLDAVRHHHEALDGSGYPDGLKGDQITPIVRILTVCDIFAALVEARPYKAPRPPQEAISMLVDMALDGKVDYQPIRQLAQVFGMSPPKTLAEVNANLRRIAVRA